MNWVKEKEKKPPHFNEVLLFDGDIFLLGYYDENYGIYRDSNEGDKCQTPKYWRYIDYPPED